MNKSLMKKNELTKIINKSIVDLPAPSNLSTWWNFGSLLGMCLMLQLITGIMISMHYTANTEMAFNSIMHISRNVNYGWLMRMMHSNGASMLFVCLYLHTGRSMYYGSYKNKKTWNTGIMMMLMMMATAFMGYVLPWGQMSLWGATVITNLFSAVPYMGNTMVKWMWGGFSVNNATLTRFFSLHFMMPFLMTMMSMIHLMFLHNKGSNNPMGTNSNMDKIPFHPFYLTKDIMGFSMMMYMFMMMNLYVPNMMNDPENFTKANQMVTPIHIQPEWYFLFAYTILRSIPNKLGGVLSLMLSIMILIIMPMTMKMKFKGLPWYPMSQFMMWTFVMTTIMLTWIGSKPVEDPFSLMGKKLTFMYFLYFMLDPMMTKMWDKMIK